MAALTAGLLGVCVCLFVCLLVRASIRRVPCVRVHVCVRARVLKEWTTGTLSTLWRARASLDLKPSRNGTESMRQSTRLSRTWQNNTTRAVRKDNIRHATTWHGLPRATYRKTTDPMPPATGGMHHRALVARDCLLRDRPRRRVGEHLHDVARLGDAAATRSRQATAFMHTDSIQHAPDSMEQRTTCDIQPHTATQQRSRRHAATHRSSAASSAQQRNSATVHATMQPSQRHSHLRCSTAGATTRLRAVRRACTRRRCHPTPARGMAHSYARARARTHARTPKTRARGTCASLHVRKCTHLCAHTRELTRMCPRT
jgi:hypothetical protein